MLTRIEVGSLLGELEKEIAADPREDAMRRRVILRLFAVFRDSDVRLAEIYISETRGIPIDKLLVACRVIVRTHCYPSLPRVGDLWRVARAAAGMGREQYHAGRYLKGPGEWPPAGMRHGIERGGFEQLSGYVPNALEMGNEKRLIEADLVPEEKP